MSVFGRLMLILYFMAYLLHYLYTLKTKCGRQKTKSIFEIRVKKIRLIKTMRKLIPAVIY